MQGACHVCSDAAEIACSAVSEIIDHQEVSLLDYCEGLQTRWVDVCEGRFLLDVMS